MNEPILKIQNVSKSFPGTKALDDVTMDLYGGEVLGLCGENGAGKSTLMKIISGGLQKDSGKLLYKGEEVAFSSPRDAHLNGIGIVHQEIINCPELSVAENICMSVMDKNPKGFLDYNWMYKTAEEYLSRFNVEINVKEKLSNLSISYQQIVEIVKALLLDCSVLIFDEPTAALTEDESEKLFAIIDELRKNNIGIIYISHRLEEVFNNCDRVTILRDGQFIDTLNIKDVEVKTVINKMIGRELGDFYPEKAAGSDEEVLLSVRELTNKPSFANVSFDLRKGEILGVSGLMGSGRTETARSICGLDRKQTGSVFLEGKELSIKSYKDSISEGIVYLTENRKKEGLFLEMSITDNVSAMSLGEMSGKILMNKSLEIENTDRYCKELSVKYSEKTDKVGTLSGGNQQKILIAKLLSVSPKIVILDEPTRGIDVGSKKEIYTLIRALVDRGVGVIVISSDLEEIVGLCDRVMVFHEGTMMGDLTDKDITESNIMHMASGIAKGSNL
ncbi:MAG: sugar ABC transporter ATP-binding protein [Spirochaetales bacterium]|uniref:Sugar ABC transporter ATP-binding protein n=1 Tax=Candidatus Thalassospirochaeta sargassi TaxID=3119039 RepID=A0AAJ1MN64_9SPIO|nr:sugar ABC transporter ATP-binding protein [Spirochaetales bacterium]